MKNKGFSLVELIVVIAIMAILTSVLAPSLLAYTERSRASKDIAAMDEVVNTIMLSASNSQVYDELVNYSTNDNVSCYIDKFTDKDYAKIPTKTDPNGEVIQYTFGDDTRLADESKFYAAGQMRGVTITFEPTRDSNESEFKLSDGVINKFSTLTGIDLEDCPYLYNSIRQVIGDTLTLTSQTYRNSEYTVFIRIGTTGGNAAYAQDAIQVYGQFSGTNLSTSDTIYTVALKESCLIAGKEAIEDAVEDAKDWIDDNKDEIGDAIDDIIGGGSGDSDENPGDSGGDSGDTGDSGEDSGGTEDDGGGIGDVIDDLIGRWPWW